MIGRCTKPEMNGFEYYGGRGIRVCERWVGSFDAFLEDVGPAPTSKHTIDRYPNPAGNYEPGNVRWATYVEQAQTRRRPSRLLTKIRAIVKRLGYARAAGRLKISAPTLACVVNEVPVKESTIAFLRVQVGSVELPPTTKEKAS